jgi:hypothetical protein
MDLRGYLQQLFEQLGTDRARKYGLSEPDLDGLFEPYPWTLEVNRWALLASCSLQEIGEADPASTKASVDALLDLDLLDEISNLGPPEGGAAWPEDALVAATLLRRHGETTESFGDVPRSLESKDFYWDVPSNLHGCSLAGARLTLRRDGSASWRGVVNSIYRDDAYCVTLSFLNSGGRTLFAWPRFCSQTLWQSPQVWTTNNLAFPDHFFDSIAIVSRRDHC